MLANPPVEVHGLKELRRDLKKVDPAMGREVAQANKDAADFVLRRAQGVAAQLGGVHAHAARRGLKSKRAQKGASIVVDGQREPTALGAEFGARRWRQFPRWRGNQWNPDAGGVGYMVHPTIREHQPQIVEVYADAMDRVLRKVAG